MKLLSDKVLLLYLKAQYAKAALYSQFPLALHLDSASTIATSQYAIVQDLPVMQAPSQSP